MAFQHINYDSRNFADYVQQLTNFVKTYYPDVFSDFSDSSVGSLLIELPSAISDSLSFSIDKNFNETHIDSAQETNSIMDIARTQGVRIQGMVPSISLVDFSVVVPVYGDSFDVSYCPTIQRDSQVRGSGKVFQTISDISFDSPFSLDMNLPNRLIIPNLSSNNKILNYTLTKRELVVNGESKVFKKVLTTTDQKPFLNVILPENNVLAVDSIIILPGRNYSTNPTISDFYDDTSIYKWFEVDNLTQNTVFIQDISQVSDNYTVLPGKYIKTDQKFITEYTNNGFLKIIFGAGTTPDTSGFCNYGVSNLMANKIGDLLSNNSFGSIPTSNYTMFIRYRIGGGASSNIGVGTLTSLGNINFVINGANPQINQAVKASLKASNPMPAMGGKDRPSIEEMRYLVKYNSSAQNRCIQLKDYIAKIGLMKSSYGAPYKYNVAEEQNMVVVYIIGIDENGYITNSSTSTLRDNLSEYLSDYRSLNDYVVIKNGSVINISITGDLVIAKNAPQNSIITEAISTTSSFFDVANLKIGQTIYVGQLIENLNNIASVINVANLKFYNMVGNTGQGYSFNESSMGYVSETNGERELDVVNNNYSITLNFNELVQIKYPNIDIKFRVITT